MATNSARSFPPPQFLPERLAEVHKLEKQRRYKKYRKGWLFKRCEALGLLAEARYLESIDAFGWKAAEAKLIPGTLFDFPTLELIPYTCRGQNVRNVVSPEDWEELRLLTLLKAKHRCQLCGAAPAREDLHCHEIWEYDDAKSTQRLKYLVALCTTCHDIKHFNMATDFGKAGPAFAKMLALSKLDADELNIYIEQHKELAKHRSRTQWTLEILLIAQAGYSPSRGAWKYGVRLSEGGRRINNYRPQNNYRNSNEVITPLPLNPSVETTEYREFSYQVPPRWSARQKALVYLAVAAAGLVIGLSLKYWVIRPYLGR